MSRTSAALAPLAIIAAAVACGFLPVLYLGFEEGLARGGLLDAYVLQVIWFTVLQAGLSTVLSVGLAVPIARAFYRRQFPGRVLLLRLFALPLALPAIVVILGIIEVYGRTGWASRLIGHQLDIYGLSGILLAHVFFNLPLATRMLLQRLEAVSLESWRLAEQLAFAERDRFRLIEWPALAQALGGVASLIFLLCAASFAVVLTLGGGPGATTLEVAIYQALRFDYDPARATVLGFAQLAIGVGFVVIAGRHAGTAFGWPALRPRRLPAPSNTGAGRSLDAVLLLIGSLFVAMPIIAIVTSGVMADFDSGAIVRAGATSIGLATGAALSALALAWPAANAFARMTLPRSRALVTLVSLLPLILPPAVLATGWFIIASRFGAPLSAAPFMVIAMNALMALPFAMSVLAPAMRATSIENDRLCANLGLAGWPRLSLIDVPILKAPLGLALALSFIVSLGDLTAISLFGSQDLVTLPALILAQMGSYRIDAAAGSALVLALMSFGLILGFEKLGSHS